MRVLAELFAVFAALLPFHDQRQAETDASTPPPVCASAFAALERGELESALRMYIDLVASDRSATCALEGLAAISTASHAEARYCTQGKALAAAGEKAAARRRYVAALRINPASSCAKSGLSATGEPTADSKDEKSGLEQASATATNALKLVGSAAVAALILAGLLLTAMLMVRRRRPSLSIDPFVDGGVEPKVGAAVGALVEKRLIDLSRNSGRGIDEGYLLDLVVADTELLAANQSLETALGGLAEASQFTLVVAVLGLADRMYGTHLVAKGELAPKGGEGHGVVLALQSERNGLQAREALWNESRAGAKNPKPYYELAEPAAAWVQYETARSLDPRVELITTNAKSFSLLSLGLAEQRLRRNEAAAERYAEALAVDPENVAAMFNLGAILSGDDKWFWKGFLLSVRALTILEARHEERE